MEQYEKKDSLNPLSERDPFSSLNKSKQKGSMKLFTKVIVVGLICLLLMIPLLMVSNLATERKYGAVSVENEISEKWGGRQNVVTPVLVIPYVSLRDTSTVGRLYILPRELQASAELNMEMRHRSIYQVPVYTTQIQVNGAWNTEDIRQAVTTLPNNYQLEKAKIALSVTDSKGYKDLVFITVNGQKLRMSSDNDVDLLLRSSCDDNDCFWDYKGITTEPSMSFMSEAQSVSYPITLGELDQELRFDCSLFVSGSKNFGILGMAATSNVNIKGNWNAPSFQGNSLPIKSEVTNNGFSAQWKSFYPDNYVDGELLSNLIDNGSYISFVKPANHYTQTDRSIKYGILVIVLSMLSIFLVELGLLRRDKTINVLHYLLSGLSLVLFYSLLLSFSEIVGFGYAYLVATLMTVGLNCAYFFAVLKEKGRAFLIAGIMLFLYLAVYVLMQMQTYALLTGSLGLFCILAFVMFYSAKMLDRQ